MKENIIAKDKNGTDVTIGDFVKEGKRFGKVKSLEDPWGIDVYNTLVTDMETKRSWFCDARLLEKVSNEEAMVLMLEL